MACSETTCTTSGTCTYNPQRFGDRASPSEIFYCFFPAHSESLSSCTPACGELLRRLGNHRCLAVSDYDYSDCLSSLPCPLGNVSPLAAPSPLPCPLGELFAPCSPSSPTPLWGGVFPLQPQLPPRALNRMLQWSPTRWSPCAGLVSVRVCAGTRGSRSPRGPVAPGTCCGT